MPWNTEANFPSVGTSSGSGCNSLNADNDHISYVNNHTVETIEYDGTTWNNLTATGTGAPGGHCLAGNSGAAIKIGGISGSYYRQSYLWSGTNWVTGPTSSYDKAYGNAWGTDSAALVYGDLDSTWSEIRPVEFNGVSWGSITYPRYVRVQYPKSFGTVTSAITTGGYDLYASPDTGWDFSSEWNDVSWSSISGGLITGRGRHGVGGSSTLGYITGGTNGEGNTNYLDSTEEWNGTAWSTSTHTYLAGATAYLHGQSTGGKNYQCSGYSGSSTRLNVYRWSYDVSVACTTGELVLAPGPDPQRKVFKDPSRARIVSVVPSQLDWGSSARINFEYLADPSGLDVYIGGVLQTVTGTGANYIDFTVVQGTNVYGDADVLVEYSWVRGDQMYDDVTLLISADGVDANQTFTDSGPDARTITTSGTIQHDTSRVYPGTTSSIQTPNSSSSNYLVVSGGAGTVMAMDQPVTLEVWIYPDSSFTSHRGLFSSRYNSQFPFYELNFWLENNLTAWIAYTDGPTGPQWGSSNACTWDAWNHVAFSRHQDGRWRTFINGVVGAENDPGVSYTLNNKPMWLCYSDVYTGSPTAAGEAWYKYFRITRGVTRYWDEFIPPTSFPDFR